MPFFQNLTFLKSNTEVMGRFIRSMKQKAGKTKGNSSSKKRINNVLLPLRAIWNDACDEYRWELPDPFKKTASQMPKEEASG